VGHSPGGSTLRVFCKLCKTELSVPNGQFVAGFDLAIPYPGKKAVPAPPPRVLRPGDDGEAEILAFPTPDAGTKK
jgi:hypothetical protein